MQCYIIEITNIFKRKGQTNWLNGMAQRKGVLFYDTRWVSPVNDQDQRKMAPPVECLACYRRSVLKMEHNNLFPETTLTMILKQPKMLASNMADSRNSKHIQRKTRSSCE